MNSIYVKKKKERTNYRAPHFRAHKVGVYPQNFFASIMQTRTSVISKNDYFHSPVQQMFGRDYQLIAARVSQSLIKGWPVHTVKSVKPRVRIDQITIGHHV